MARGAEPGGDIVAEGTRVLYPSRAKIAFVVAASAAFLAIGVAFEFTRDPFLSWAIGVPAILFGGAGIVAAVRLVATARTPVIVFEHDGVAFRGPAEKQYVEWRNLRAAWVCAVRRTRFVALLPYDVDGLIAEAGPARRAAMRANVALVGAPVCLPTTTSLHAEELLAVVAAYAPHAVPAANALP